MQASERLSSYDEGAIRELLDWKSPAQTLRGRVGDRVERSVDWVMGHVPTGLVDNAVGWVIPRLRDVTWRATSQPLVIRAYQRSGIPLRSIPEISGLGLQDADLVAGNKRVHEGAVAGVEGAAAGFFGGFTLAADIAATMLLSIRAVQSRGLVYGFDPSDEEELVFVLRVLDAASRLGPSSKSSARTLVLAAGTRVAGSTVAKEGLAQVLQRLPKQQVVRLAAMKSESVAPVVGSVTSGAFNAWYLQSVTHTARMAYRERFLRRTYGDDLLTAYGL